MSLLQDNTLEKLEVRHPSWENDGKVALIEEAIARNRNKSSYFSSMQAANFKFGPANLGRIFLCGSPYAGKTRLKMSMMRTCKKWSKSESIPEVWNLQRILKLWWTQGVEVELLRDDEWGQVYIWDLAGQYIFRALQDLIFPRTNTSCIFVFVFNPFQENSGTLKENVYGTFRSEMEEWLKFIVSNSQITGSPPRGHRFRVQDGSIGGNWSNNEVSGGLARAANFRRLLEVVLRSKHNSCKKIEDAITTNLTAAFFPRFEIHYRHTSIKKLGMSENCITWYLGVMMVRDNGYEIFVVSDEVIGQFVDILVKSSQVEVKVPRRRQEVMKFVMEHVLQEIQAFCASQHGCPGIELEVDGEGSQKTSSSSSSYTNPSLSKAELTKGEKFLAERIDRIQITTGFGGSLLPIFSDLDTGKCLPMSRELFEYLKLKSGTSKDHKMALAWSSLQCYLDSKLGQGGYGRDFLLYRVIFRWVAANGVNDDVFPIIGQEEPDLPYHASHKEEFPGNFGGGAQSWNSSSIVPCELEGWSHFHIFDSANRGAKTLCAISVLYDSGDYKDSRVIRLVVHKVTTLFSAKLFRRSATEGMESSADAKQSTKRPSHGRRRR
ncbi:hypothetical protein R1flu_016778 [Riccia fluitans]|uniref:Uncharacterized protein n=1 Tax=Riccia fluitans TaxID=41844 RepID=A0ABD1YRP7_9MARC